ncbi:calpain-13-like [Anomaloglossus baeobatrachus]|uniref:calpain-13-like n=1 Tax=Anomaloglossus baeobatrachus TaxID=238106 RepID=UPI003F4F9936
MPLPGVYQNVAEGQTSQRKIGTVQNPKKFKGQDFNSIRDQCISRKQLFEDDEFPTNLYSIGEKLLTSQDKMQNIKWKRPTEWQTDAHFLVDGASIFDLMQGEIGDCWVLSVVGALTLHRKFLENVIPVDQGYTKKYAGIFHFRFWQFGEWVDVVVDDRLPMLNGRFVFLHPRTSNEFWPSLLEKAYAKLRGSYQNLHWGVISDAMVDFTGGVPMYFNITKSPLELQNVILGAARSGSLMGCTTPGGLLTGNSELPNGLIKGHAYTVTDSKQIVYKNRLEDIIRIWNPWGRNEWNGRWSDKAPQWENVSPEIRRKLNSDKNDGEFWMSCEDFMKNFVSMYICNHTPTFLDFGFPRYCWETTSYYNQWVGDSAAGGCSSTEDMWKNPQYIITVPESQGPKRGYNVTVALMQSLSNERKCNPPWLPIGFAFCKVTVKETKTGTQQKYSPHHVTDTIVQEAKPIREISKSFAVQPGTYVILPFTRAKGREAKFLLRIFIKTSQIAENEETKTTTSERKREVRSSSVPAKYSDIKSSEKIRQLRSNSIPAQPTDNAAILNERIQEYYYRRSSLQCSDTPAMLNERSQERFTRRSSSPYSEHERSAYYRSREPCSSGPSSQFSDNETWASERSRECRSSSIPSHDFDSALSLNAQNPKVVLTKYQEENYEDIFTHYTNQTSEMNAENLQMLLNDVVITDQSLVADKGHFSLDSCRWMLLLMDLNGNGKLSLNGFCRLLKQLNRIKDVFRTIDVNRSGFIDRCGLAKAVHDRGLVVSDAVMKIMILRYANFAQKLSFVDFTCCMIRLDSVTNVFQKLRKEGPKVYLSAEDWLQIIMSA